MLDVLAWVFFIGIGTAIVGAVGSVVWHDRHDPDTWWAFVIAFGTLAGAIALAWSIVRLFG